MTSPNPEQLDSYIINVRSFEQQLPWSCGPSCIRTVLYHHYRIDLTDRELITVLGSSEENGTSDFGPGLRLLGIKYKEYEHGNLNKLKSWILKDCLPIVHVVMPDGEGHYMVVTGYDNDNIYLHDPAKGKIITYGLPFFMGIWKTEEFETQTRWFLVITGYTKNKIGSLIKKLKNIKKKIESS